VLATPRTELLQRQSIGIISAVLLGVVASLTTLVASERDQHPIRSFRHNSTPLSGSRLLC
jgi:predicted glycoside hydrolase/deacetylase ChbG (UPF0249 family)